MAASGPHRSHTGDKLGQLFIKELDQKYDVSEHGDSGWRSVAGDCASESSCALELPVQK